MPNYRAKYVCRLCGDSRLILKSDHDEFINLRAGLALKPPTEDAMKLHRHPDGSFGKMDFQGFVREGEDG